MRGKGLREHNDFCQSASFLQAPLLAFLLPGRPFQYLNILNILSVVNNLLWRILLRNRNPAFGGRLRPRAIHYSSFQILSNRIKYAFLVNSGETARGRPPSRAGEPFSSISHSIYTWISTFPGSGQPSARQSRFIIIDFQYFNIPQ